MHRALALFLCSWAGMAQAPQRSPLEDSIQAYWKARSDGRFAEAAAAREKARILLQSTPLDAPQFQGWLQSIAQLYENAGRTAQARALTEEALSRSATLPEAHPIRV